MSDASALLAAIRARPGDDAPRLVYADWLDEHGKHERADWIRRLLALPRHEPRPAIKPHMPAPDVIAWECCYDGNDARTPLSAVLREMPFDFVGMAADEMTAERVGKVWEVRVRYGAEG